MCIADMYRAISVTMREEREKEKEREDRRETCGYNDFTRIRVRRQTKLFERLPYFAS